MDLHRPLRCHGGGACRQCHEVPGGCGVLATVKWLAGAGAGAVENIVSRPPKVRGWEKLADFESQGARVSMSPETKTEGQVWPSL